MEDNRRTVLALFLCFVVVFFYSEMFVKPQLKGNIKPPAASATPDASNPVTFTAAPGGTTIATTPISVQNTPSGTPTLAETAANPTTVVESSVFRVRITHLGGRLSSVALRNYRDHIGDDTPLDLVHPREGAPLPLGIYRGGENDGRVSYELKTVSQGPTAQQGVYQVPATGELVLTFAGVLPSGNQISKVFRFQPDSYLFSVEASVTAKSNDNSIVGLEWAQHLNLEASDSRHQRTGFSITSLSDEGSRPTRSYVRKPDDIVNLLDSTVWTSVADPYFMEALINGKPPRKTVVSTHAVNRENEAAYNYFSILSEGSRDSVGAQIYVGPKEYSRLTSLPFELHKNIDLGFFAFLAYPLLSALRFFYHLLGNYGLAIILLTLTVKALFLPLNQASLKSMSAMQELQPEMKALRERIKDPTQLNQEMMALYKRRGINPLGGCLPIMVQIPVFFGLYNALLNAIDLRHSPFALWVTDLSSPERLHVLGVGVPVMVLIMGASMLYQQARAPSTMDPNQKRMMLMMTLMFVLMFIIFPMPSGLVLYMLVNNFTSIAQQAALKKDARLGPWLTMGLTSLAIFGLGLVLTLL